MLVVFCVYFVDLIKGGTGSIYWIFGCPRSANSKQPQTKETLKLFSFLFSYNSQSLWPGNQKTWNHKYSALISKWISDGKSLDQKCGNPDLLGSSHRANRVWQRSVQQSSSNCKIEYLVLWVLRKHLWHFCQIIQMFKWGFLYFGLFFYCHLFYMIMIFDNNIIIIIIITIIIVAFTLDIWKKSVFLIVMFSQPLPQWISQRLTNLHHSYHQHHLKNFLNISDNDVFPTSPTIDLTTFTISPSLSSSSS